MAHARQATLADARYLAPRLRDIDARECELLGRSSPLAALTAGVDTGNALSMISNDDEVMGMFGVAYAGTPGVGAAWMLCSDVLVNDRSHRRQFLREGPAAILWMHKEYPVLFNYILKENRIAIRWLKSLGFEFQDTVHPQILLFKKELLCANQP